MLTRLYLVIISVLLSACGGGGDGNADSLPVTQAPTPNTAPIAEISLSSESFIAGTEVSFSGRDSSDIEDDSLTFLWSLEKPKFSVAQLDSTTNEVILFRPDAIGEYTLTLTVTDTQNKSTSIAKSFVPKLPPPQSLSAFPAKQPPIGIIKDKVDAVRFLTQSTFGPTVQSVDDLLAEGGEVWFNEQLNLPFTSWTQLRKTSWIEEVDPLYSDQNGRMWIEELFSETAQNSPDQLRHRMTYILSQLFVVSTQTDLANREIAFTDYWDTLGENAFGNFRDLLEDVTLHTTMGHYLNMMGNQKSDPEKNIRPDENFAREVMQLFTIGLRELNQDGSVKVNSTGEAIETYDQNTVTQYAAALTGWYYDTTNFEANPESDFSCSIACYPMDISTKPMVAFDHIHQKTEKMLLRNYFIPPGQTAEEDLQIVIDSLFNHPNLAPFFSMHLIRQMVTSNPSRAYVGRVSAVFNNNGQGIRGDLGATVKAVLFDEEARRPQLSEISLYGKVKEPALAITQLNRLFKIGIIPEIPLTVAKDKLWGTHQWMRMAGTASQRALNSESVFNFFRPDFAPNGAISDMGFVAPELQITTESSIVNDVEMFRWLTTKEQWNWEINNGRDKDQFTIAYNFTDLDSTWETGGYPAVVDFLNLYMTGNRMDLEYKSHLLSFSQNPEYRHVFDGRDPSWNDQSDKMERHMFLSYIIYLIVTTPEFRVQR